MVNEGWVNIARVPDLVKTMTDGRLAPSGVAIQDVDGSGPAETDTPRTLLRLAQAFQTRYPAEHKVLVVRAPGRVNLIGEHLDYNGYPVLPMAIDREILLLLAPSNGPEIEVHNLDHRFAVRRFRIDEKMTPYAAGDWGNYVKAALRGVMETEGTGTGWQGLRAYCGSSLPVAAGLSSSAALVVAAAVAFLAVNRRMPFDPLRLAEILARAERFVGTESGGMDQAAALAGEAGKALKIDFFPLRVEPVAMPSECAVVIAHSLVDASKSGTARNEYNRRVVECRLAAGVLARALEVPPGRDRSLFLLADLSPTCLNRDRGFLEQLARQLFGERPLALADVARLLGEPEEQVLRIYGRLQDGSVLAPPGDGFKLLRRYRHVVSEEQRVRDAVTALRGNDPEAFGRLMNASHASCRDDYQVSCTELEELTVAALACGALGARLTGAGFGGCTVNLIRRTDLKRFLFGLEKMYYAPRHHQPDGTTLFAVRAVGGAGILHLDTNDKDFRETNDV